MPPRAAASADACVRRAVVNQPDHEALLRLSDSHDVELRTEPGDLDREVPPQG